MSTKQHIAWVTSEKYHDLISTEQPLVEALRLQYVVDVVVWDDPKVNWSAYQLIVVRSIWDYHLKTAQFLDWLGQMRQIGSLVMNPVDVLLWNYHKFYLREISDLGLPVVPTRWVKQRDHEGLMEAIEHFQPGSGVIVKPAVSASAYGLKKLNANEASDGLQLQSMVDENDLLVQPFIPEIELEGEWSLMFFNKQFSHAVLKHPGKGEFRVQQELGGSVKPVIPSRVMIDQVLEIIAAVNDDLLYCRVDGVVIQGKFTLMELELIEPDLFLQSASACDNFTKAIQQYL